MHLCAKMAQGTVHQWKLSVHETPIWAVAWQNRQINKCAQQSLRSSWESAQSDHSLRCLHDETLTRSSTTYWAHSEDSRQTRCMPRLIWVVTGCIGHFVGFVMLVDQRKRACIFWLQVPHLKSISWLHWNIHQVLIMVLLVSEVGSMSDLQSDSNTGFTSSKPGGTIKLVGYWKKVCAVWLSVYLSRNFANMLRPHLAWS